MIYDYEGHNLITSRVSAWCECQKPYVWQERDKQHTEHVLEVARQEGRADMSTFIEYLDGMLPEGLVSIDVCVVREMFRTFYEEKR